MTMMCDDVMSDVVLSLPLFSRVIVFPASPNAPYSWPSLFASDDGDSVPFLTIVPPVYLLMLFILTVPVPSTTSCALPSIAPLPEIVYDLVLFLKTMLPGVTFSAMLTSVAVALSSNVTSSPVTNFLSEEEKFSVFMRSQAAPCSPVQTTFSLSRPSWIASISLPSA